MNVSQKPRPHLLPDAPGLPAEVRNRLARDFEEFARGGLPRDLEGYLFETYRLDVSSSYAGLPIRNPWGKASGQLSMRTAQVAEDAEGGLGFVVLKTVIAQDALGGRSMDAWAIKESRMVVEPIIGRETGAKGWTVTWKGRGWWESLEAYLELVSEAVSIGQNRGLLVAPSVKYHLPGPGETGWRAEEYAETTRLLLDAFRAGGGRGPMPLEKDFSPTLAGSDRARERAKILSWLDAVPGLIRSAVGREAVKVGLKLLNALDDDEFQLELLQRVHISSESQPDFIVYANRLFDPGRTFEGHQGVAYGGPDLSDRNLTVLSSFRRSRLASESPATWLELSATGDIHSGRLAVEYLLQGCSSFQIHTFFQLPSEAFAMTRGSRVERALHMLYFDPQEGLIAWLLHAAARLLPQVAGPVRLVDLARLGACSALRRTDLDAERSQLVD
jgi:hypothetical protein